MFSNHLFIRLTSILAVPLFLFVGLTDTSNSEFKLPSRYNQDEIHRAVMVYAQHYRLDPMLLRAIIKVESNFRQDAVSRRGAVGLMQLMPGTAARLKVVDIHDSLQNIQGGAKHLRHLLNRYHGDLPLALAAYNAGSHRVKRTVPSIQETRAYIQKVLTYYHVYRGQVVPTKAKRGMNAT